MTVRHVDQDREALVAEIATELVTVVNRGKQIPSLQNRWPALDLPLAYEVARAVRNCRESLGERVVGRKIGFTNRTIWAEYDVHHPIWGYMYDSTVQDLSPSNGASLAGLAEPRIEPEIIFGLGRAPAPGMTSMELIACVEWVAHGFEIVQSLFADWRFTAPETVAAFGLHGRLFIGPRHALGPDPGLWLAPLQTFGITLKREGTTVDRGRAANVLDGPLHALAHLVAGLDHDPSNPPLAAGDIVTTGTLTRAFPVAPGESWSTALEGIALEPAMIQFEASAAC